jgi:hypothetical protein
MVRVRRSDRFGVCVTILSLCILCTSVGCAPHHKTMARRSAPSAPPPATLTTASANSTQSPVSPPKSQAPQPVVNNRAAGHMVDGPANLRRFSPDESDAIAVDAQRINLRQVFEDLGPDATLWYQHVQTLSNPFFEGRAPGTRGADLAAEYMEFYFRMYGLAPAFPGAVAQLGGERTAAFTSYLQDFDFASPAPKATVISANVLFGDSNLQEGTDFMPLGVSGNGEITAPLTFVGYGIEEGANGYSSFDEHCDLTGRIALVLRYEPLNDNGKSAWSQVRFSRFASIAPKFKAIVDRHAAGIIMVNPPEAADAKPGLEELVASTRFGARQKVPVIQVSSETADKLIADADPLHRSLLAWRRLADNDEVNCVHLDDSFEVTISTNLDVDDRMETRNVAGILRGRGSLADEWIVIGGHYDHLGTGYTGAMNSANVGQLHPGADDNASGTAGVLMAAKRLSERYHEVPQDKNLRSIVFMGFGAEEAGLHGSKHFVENCPVPIHNISLMMNMDMIGRLRSDSLALQGTGTAREFDDMLNPLVESSGLTVHRSPGGRGPSDHQNFYDHGIPVLFFFTGEHDDYHRPGDQAYTVNPAGAAKVMNLLDAIAWDAATRPQRLTFVQAASGGDPRRTGARVRFGIQPDYTAELETGVRVDSVSDGTSAANAGIQAGDVLLTWNDEELTGGQKLMEFISKGNPGDTVKVGLRRGDAEMIVDVTLKAREQQE